jgi:hypothetical protein
MGIGERAADKGVPQEGQKNKNHKPCQVMPRDPQTPARNQQQTEYGEVGNGNMNLVQGIEQRLGDLSLLLASSLE